MAYAINNIVPWQATILLFAGISVFVLFLSSVFLILYFPDKISRKDTRMRPIFRIIFFGFIISFAIFVLLTITLLIDIELGWKASLLAGASVILGFISFIVMLLGLIKDTPLRAFFIWVFLFFISFAVVVALLTMKGPKAEITGVHRRGIYSLEPPLP